MQANERRVELKWRDGLAFSAGATGKAHINVDGDAASGPSPMEALLISCAACTGADIVSILAKMRVTLKTCRIQLTGERREEEPRRYVKLRFTYVLGGGALDESKARRAIDLSLEKYCSVLHSLAPDIETQYELVLV